MLPVAAAVEFAVIGWCNTAEMVAVVHFAACSSMIAVPASLPFDCRVNNWCLSACYIRNEINCACKRGTAPKIGPLNQHSFVLPWKNHGKYILQSTCIVILADAFRFKLGLNLVMNQYFYLLRGVCASSWQALISRLQSIEQPIVFFAHVSVAQEIECWTLHLVGSTTTRN